MAAIADSACATGVTDVIDGMRCAAGCAAGPSADGASAVDGIAAVLAGGAAKQDDAYAAATKCGGWRIDDATTADDAVLVPDDVQTHVTVVNVVGGAGWNDGTGRKLEAGETNVAAATRNGATGAANAADNELKTEDDVTAINAIVTAAPMNDGTDEIDGMGQHGEE